LTLPTSCRPIHTTPLTAIHTLSLHDALPIYYPVTGDPSSDARSYKKVNERTLALTIKKGGKTTISGRIGVAADGNGSLTTLLDRDRKSTRLNSSHGSISYAVFCLTKKHQSSH